MEGSAEGFAEGGLCGGIAEGSPGPSEILPQTSDGIHGIDMEFHSLQGEVAPL